MKFKLPFELIDLIILNDRKIVLSVVPILKCVGSHQISNFINNNLKRYKCFYINTHNNTSKHITYQEHYFIGYYTSPKIQYNYIENQLGPQAHMLTYNVIYHRKNLDLPYELVYHSFDPPNEQTYEFKYDKSNGKYNIITDKNYPICIFKLSWIKYYSNTFSTNITLSHTNDTNNTNNTDYTDSEDSNDNLIIPYQYMIEYCEYHDYDNISQHSRRDIYYYPRMGIISKMIFIKFIK